AALDGLALALSGPPTVRLSSAPGLQPNPRQQEVEAADELIAVVVTVELVDDVVDERKAIRIERAPLRRRAGEVLRPAHVSRDDRFGRLLAQVGGGADHVADHG